MKLHTGLTHQIRVQWQHLGFPIVDDPLYGRRHNACSQACSFEGGWNTAKSKKSKDEELDDILKGMKDIPGMENRALIAVIKRHRTERPLHHHLAKANIAGFQGDVGDPVNRHSR